MNDIPKSIAGEAWFGDPALRRIFALLNGEGGEVRIVGGAIRNALMGLEVADIDLATTLKPEEVMSRAEAAGIRAVPTGIDHGTVTLVIDGRGFETTTLRRDVETSGRHAKVAFDASWHADAERRDFTINALYADEAGVVSDFVGGFGDIQTRTVRFIGDAGERIGEDHLRILRFFRFFAWYGSGRPDGEALRACARLREHVEKLSAERVWKELKGLLGAPDPGRALLWMRQAGVLDTVLPETEKWGIDTVPGLIAVENQLGWSTDPMLRLMSIVPPDEERLGQMAVRLKLSRVESERLQDWALTPSFPPSLAGTALDRLLYTHGKRAVEDRLRIALAVLRVRAGASDDPGYMEEAAGLNRLLLRAVGFQKPEFPLSGRNLAEAGMEPGPEMGSRLKAAQERWIASNFTLDRAALLAFALGED